jgi:hypothetical protein
MLQQHGRGDLADQENRTIVAIADGMSALRAQREDLEVATRQRAKNLSKAEPVYEQTATKTADAIASLIELHRQIDVEMKIEGDRPVEQARLIVIGVVDLLGLLVVSIYLMMKRLVLQRLNSLHPRQIALLAMTSRLSSNRGPHKMKSASWQIL